jgi:L-alanine-DL-glutamate epimerase-like enolase superfamily enzyme
VELKVWTEAWAFRAPFRIAYEEFTAAEVVVVELTALGATGRGEAAGVSYHGETAASLAEQIETARDSIERGVDRHAVQSMFSAGGARNALDCALWDLEAKQTGTPAWMLAGQVRPEPMRSWFTLGLAPLDVLASQARAAAKSGLGRLKIKLAGEGDLDRVQMVRNAAPRARLIVDANQSWTETELADYPRALAGFGVELIEQPLPVGADRVLEGAALPIPICADESCQDAASIDALVGKYQALCIKLDKTGGLTEALALVRRAKTLGFKLMIGNMCGTSLAMAPATLIGNHCDFIDLDGPLLNTSDRPIPIDYCGDLMRPAPRELWG